MFRSMIVFSNLLLALPLTAYGQSSTEATQSECRDEIDNDNDGDVDCEDAQCQYFVFCSEQVEPSEESEPDEEEGPPRENSASACRDGIDNDQDTHIDCDDQDCEYFVFCSTSHVAEETTDRNDTEETTDQPEVSATEDDEGDSDEQPSEISYSLEEIEDMSQRAGRLSTAGWVLSVIGGLAAVIGIGFWARAEDTDGVIAGIIGVSTGTTLLVPGIIFLAISSKRERRLRELRERHRRLSENSDLLLANHIVEFGLGFF